MTDITDIANNQISRDEKDDLEMESKKKKLHPRSEDDSEECSHSKRRKTSAKNSQEREIFNENKNSEVEAEITQEENNKLQIKSASKPRSRLRSKSRSNLKSNKSRSRSRSKTKDLSVNSYTLRPRKNVDYTKNSPCDEIKRSDTGNESDENDMSFKAEENSQISNKSPEKIGNVNITNDIIVISPHLPEEQKLTESATANLNYGESMDVNIDETENKKDEIPIELQDDSEDNSVDEKALSEELNELKNENIENEKEDYEKFKKENDEFPPKEENNIELMENSSGEGNQQADGQSIDN